MRGLLWLGLVLAACHDHGVVILVDPPADVTVAHVRLYVGQGDGTDASYLQTAPSAATTPANARVELAEYWSRDPYNAADVVDVAAGKSAGFTLVSTGQDTIPIILAIGYDAQWNPVGTAVKTDIEIPAKDFTGYHMALHGPVSPLLDGDSARQLALWSANATPAQDAACAGLVVDTGDNKAVFVVTEHDQDCDGLVTGDPLECDPDAYLGTRPATRGELSCLAKSNQPNNCYLGGATCTDGVPRNTSACEPTTYCAPLTACAACGASLDCATDVTAIAGVTSYHCTVPVLSSGMLCPDDLVLRRPPTGGYDCTDVAIRDLVDKRFTNDAMLDNVSLSVQVDQGCHITMTPSGTIAVAAKGGGALLAIDLDNGHGLGIPVTFVPQTVPTCTGQPHACTPDAPVYEPELTACMAGWNPPTLVPGLTPSTTTDLLDPTLPEDESELYYASAGDIWVAKRDPQTGGWMAGMPVDELSSGEPDSSPNISPDGKTMLLVSSRVAGTPTVYISKRTDVTAPWSAPTALVPPMANVVFNGAAADATGTHVVLSINENNTGYFLEENVLGPTGLMTVPTIQLTMPVALANNTSPYLTPDGLHLYFTSDATITGAVSTEIYVVSRNTIDDPFTDPVLLHELGSPGRDEGPWVSRDAHTMYFTSNRNGLFQIYRTTR